MFASSPKSKREQRDPRLTAHMDGESRQPTSMTPGQHLVSPDMLDRPLLRPSIIRFPVLKLRFPIATRLAVTFAFSMSTLFWCTLQVYVLLSVESRNTDFRLSSVSFRNVASGATAVSHKPARCVMQTSWLMQRPLVGWPRYAFGEVEYQMAFHFVAVCALGDDVEGFLVLSSMREPILRD